MDFKQYGVTLNLCFLFKTFYEYRQEIFHT